MAKVKLLLEDTEDGLVEFRADYTGGFDQMSDAHKMANQIILHLDHLFSSQLDISVEGTPHGHA